MALLAQIALLVAAGVAALTAWLAGRRLRVAGRGAAGVRVGQVATLLAGMAAYALHAAWRGEWTPLTDNFDALTLLGLVTTGVALTMGLAARRTGWVDAGLLPIAMAAFVAAWLFGVLRPHHYATADLWLGAHRGATYLGATASAMAAVAGGAYLLLSKRLRDHAEPAPQLGSLATLERATMAAVSLGFALLTVGVITGLSRLDTVDESSAGGLKLLLTLGVWVVYGVVLAGALAPRLRGRPTAVLSVVGFALMATVVVVVQFM